MSVGAERAYRTGAILQVLTGAAHTAGQFVRPQFNTQEQAMVDSMKAVRVRMMGMEFSQWDVLGLLSVDFGLLCCGLGIINWLALKGVAGRRGGLFPLSAANTLLAAGATAAAWHYRVAPPLTTAAATLVAFAVATWFARNRE